MDTRNQPILLFFLHASCYSFRTVVVGVGGGRMEDPWPGQTSPYSEQHNAEQHNVKKHNTEKYDAEKHNTEKHSADKHNGQSTTTTHGIYEMKAIFFSPKTGKKKTKKQADC